MSVFFTSDWHIGHTFAARHRGFSSLDEHDMTIIENTNSLVGKRDKLYILGDVCFAMNRMPLFHLLKVREIEMIFGNHDKFNVQVYLKYFNKIHGFYKYKGAFLSHCPIHPQELYRVSGNIHGHIHNNFRTKPLEDSRYFNVNVDLNGFKPVSFDTIKEQLRGTNA